MMAGWVKCRDYLPEKSGKYIVEINGVRTSMAIYLVFDGEKWVGLDVLEQRYKNRDVYWKKYNVEDN